MFSVNIKANDCSIHIFLTLFYCFIFLLIYVNTNEFNLSFSIVTTIQIIAFMNISGLVPLSDDRIYRDKWGYVLLDLLGRSVFEFLAFATVTIVWFRTVVESNATTNVSNYYHNTNNERNNNGDESNNHLSSLLRLLTLNNLSTVTRWIVSFMVVILVSLGGIVTIIVLIDSPDDEDILQLKQRSVMFQIQILIEALSWLVHAMFVIFCMYLTTESILQKMSTFGQQFCSRKKFSLLSKVLIPMSVCAVCYLGRSIWLLTTLIFLKSSLPYEWTGRLHILWWIGFVWIPTLVMFTMALYSLRIRDQHTTATTIRGNNNNLLFQDNYDLMDPLLITASSSGRQQTLATHIPPPVEAFLAFRKFNDIITNKSNRTTAPTFDSPTLANNIQVEEGTNEDQSE